MIYEVIDHQRGKEFFEHVVFLALTDFLLLFQNSLQVFLVELIKVRLLLLCINLQGLLYVILDGVPDAINMDTGAEYKHPLKAPSVDVKYHVL